MALPSLGRKKKPLGGAQTTDWEHRGVELQPPTCVVFDHKPKLSLCANVSLSHLNDRVIKVIHSLIGLSGENQEARHCSLLFPAHSCRVQKEGKSGKTGKKNANMPGESSGTE